MANLYEGCGVFGVYSPKPGPVADLAYYGLYALQHRGQESCGIVVNDDGVFASRKDIGLVNEVFSRDDLMKFPQGRMAVACALRHDRRQQQSELPAHRGQPSEGQDGSCPQRKPQQRL